MKGFSLIDLDTAIADFHTPNFDQAKLQGSSKYIALEVPWTRAPVDLSCFPDALNVFLVRLLFHWGIYNHRRMNTPKPVEETASNKVFKELT